MFRLWIFFFHLCWCIATMQASTDRHLILLQGVGSNFAVIRAEGFQSTWHGFHMNFTRICSHRFHMDFKWISHGLYMDLFTWISHKFHMVCHNMSFLSFSVDHAGFHWSSFSSTRCGQQLCCDSRWRVSINNIRYVIICRFSLMSFSVNLCAVRAKAQHLGCRRGAVSISVSWPAW